MSQHMFSPAEKFTGIFIRKSYLPNDHGVECKEPNREWPITHKLPRLSSTTGLALVVTVGAVRPSAGQTSPKSEQCVRENRSQSVAVPGEEGMTPLLRRAEDFCREWIQLWLKIPKWACNIASVGLSLEVQGQAMWIREYSSLMKSSMHPFFCSRRE